jgi:hypothetical protein
MKIQPFASLLALALLTPGAMALDRGPAPASPAATAAASLRSRCDVELDSLRAGRPAIPTRLELADRAELRAAEATNADLLEMRAGDLTEREWTIIAIAAGVLLLVILL